MVKFNSSKKLIESVIELNLLTDREFNEVMLNFKFPSDNNVAKALNKYIQVFTKNPETIKIEHMELLKLSVFELIINIININQTQSKQQFETDLDWIKDTYDKSKELYNATTLSNVSKMNENMRVGLIPSWQGSSYSEEDIEEYCRTNLNPLEKDKLEKHNKDILVLIPFDIGRKYLFAHNCNYGRKTVLYTKEHEGMPDYFVWMARTDDNWNYDIKYFNFINLHSYRVLKVLSTIATELNKRFGMPDNTLTQMIWCKLLIPLYKTPKVTYKILELQAKQRFFYHDLKQVLLRLSVRATFLKEEEKEEERLKQLYTKSFMTLQSNTKKAIETASKSTFAKYFKQVELDGTGTEGQRVDFEKFEKLSQSFPTIQSKLPSFGNKKPVLRFRKLGHYHAIGIYFPSFNCICVDVRNTSSFVHEYGHYLDFQKYNNFSTNNDDFLDFVVTYKSELSKGLNIPKNKLKYYGLPTEVFARCFEFYFYQKNQNVPEIENFVNPNSLNSSPEYAPIKKHYPEVEKMLNEIIK